MLLFPSHAPAQGDLGHRTLGTVGLDAGTLPRPGLYVADRALYYAANQVRDRHGRTIPVPVDLDALANGIGAAIVLEVPRFATVSASVGLPLAHVSTHTDQPEASIDRFGLGDIYVQPLKLGWRLTHLDLVSGYAFYAPTGRFEPGGRGGVGRGHWTHELSLGGALSLAFGVPWSLSALASYDLNQRKRGVDITRGETLQIQGGLGATLLRFIVVGLAGFAQWQVRDDRGADLPPVLRGARDRAFGLGPEAGVLIKALRGKVALRYEHDFGVRARPLGWIVVVGLTVAAWQPKRTPAHLRGW